MKWSKYNYIFISKRHGKFLYNSFNNILWKLSEESYKEIIDLKLNIKNCSTRSSLFNILLSKRIIVENDNVDKENFMFQHRLQAFDRSYLGFTIIPTLDCNFRCTYCYEDNVQPIYMIKKVEKKIIEYFKKNTLTTKTLNITWYGGEPLLNFESIVRITNGLKKIKKLSYSASMVTNGYLLDEGIINQLDDLCIREIQITIDGPKEIHNKMRPHLKNDDSFETITGNIDKLFNKAGNKISLLIRVNVDSSNSNYYFNIYQMFTEKYKGHHLLVYPGIIKDWNGKKGCNNCSFNKSEEVFFYMKQYEEFGIKPINFFPNHITPCVAQRIYDYVIGPKGELYKCWSDVGQSDSVVGNLFDNSSNSNLLTKYLACTDPFYSKKCNDCFFIFICGGGCPHQQIKNKYYNASFETCTYFKNNIDKFLEVHFETKSKDEIKELEY